MKLTPMDIKNKEFKKGIRGYSIEEVDEFLEDVIEGYEELFKENSRLKESLTRTNDQIEHYSKVESTIQNTLLLAQNAAEQARENSQKEADLIIKNANDSAQKIIDKAHNDVIEITNEYETVKQEFIKFRAKFRNFINTQLQTFDDLEKDLVKNYNISEPVEEVKPKEVSLDTGEIKEIEQTLAGEMDEIKNFFVETVAE